jgi:hypothetical protein
MKKLTKIKKLSRKKQEAELTNLVVEMAELVGMLKGVIPNHLINDLAETITDVIKNDSAFNRILADPKSDLSKFEPVIKILMKKKKK